MTEILATPGVTAVGHLPPGCELATTYTAAVAARAAAPGEARRLITLLTAEAAREARLRAAFA